MLPEWLTRPPAGPVPRPAGRRVRRRSFLAATLAAVQAFLADALGNGPVEGGRDGGWLARADPRGKVTGVLLLLLAAALAREARTLLALHLLAVALALSTGLPVGRLLRRVWIGIPLLTAAIALPATLSWVRPGEPLLWLWRVGEEVRLGPLALPGELAVTRQGVQGALVLVLRTGTSLGYLFLLTWTTRFSGICRGLRALGVPPLFVAILAMTHRYLVVLVQLLEELFTARRARPGAVAGAAGARPAQAFVAGAIGVLLHRSEVLTREVHEAMVARGFRGEVRLYARPNRSRPWLLPLLAGLVGAVAVLSERLPGGG